MKCNYTIATVGTGFPLLRNNNDRVLSYVIIMIVSSLT